jgi:mono/diheme cytochrome c family protein
MRVSQFVTFAFARKPEAEDHTAADQRMSWRALMEYFHPAIFLLLLSATVAPPLPAQPQSKIPAQEVKRGKYLLNEGVKCPECHTPRDKNNQLDPYRWLQGAPIWIQPVFKTPDWADMVPPLAGLSNYTDEQATRVLEKGERSNGGGTVQPPMHIYHMNHADARAIIAYLRSLPSHSRTVFEIVEDAL